MRRAAIGVAAAIVLTAALGSTPGGARAGHRMNPAVAAAFPV